MDLARARQPPSLIHVWRTLVYGLRTMLHTRRALWLAAAYCGTALVGSGTYVALYHAAEEKALSVLVERGADQAQAEAGFSVASEEFMGKALELFAGVEQDEVSGVLRASVVIPILFWAALFFSPLLVILTSFDVIGDALVSRRLCYFGLRISRWEYLLGQIGAQCMAAWLLTVMAGLCVVLIASLTLSTVSAPALLLALGRSALLLIPFLFCYVALTALASTIAHHGIRPLVTAFILVVALRLVEGFGWISEDHALWFLRSLRFASPTTYDQGLWHAGLWMPMGSMLAYAAFGTLFTLVAGLLLQRRDL